jgi:hypothetical protein
VAQTDLAPLHVERAASLSLASTIGPKAIFTSFISLPRMSSMRFEGRATTISPVIAPRTFASIVGG